MAAGSGTVWVGSHLDGGLWRVDPRTGGVTRINTIGNPLDLAYHDGRIYVAGEGPGELEGNVVAYDTASGTRQDGVELWVCSITAGSREGVWTSECPNVEQLGADPRELRIVRSLTLPYREPLTSGTTRQCQCDMATGDGSVWVAGDAADPRVWRIDSKSGKVLDTIELPFPIGRGIAAGDGALWVAGPLDDLVARMDARTGRLTDRTRWAAHRSGWR